MVELRHWIFSSSPQPSQHSNSQYLNCVDPDKSNSQSGKHLKMTVHMCYELYNNVFWILLQIHFVFLHSLKGSIWDTQDQGRSRELTQWEQIDSGIQFTTTRKFLTSAPVIMWVWLHNSMVVHTVLKFLERSRTFLFF